MSAQRLDPQINVPHPNRRVIQVFVASPGDVQDARDALQAVVEELNKIWHRSGYMLELVNWKDHVIPWLGQPPEPTILKQIPVENWDVFIGILWMRFGTPTGSTDPITGQPYMSGTEEEFSLAYRTNQARGRPKLLMFRCVQPPSDIKGLDTEQYKLVQEFFTRFSKGGDHFGLISEYKAIEEFKSLVRTHLGSWLVSLQNGSMPDIEPKPGGVKEWLDSIGLSGNPFASVNASADDNLPKYYYIAAPYYDEIAGKTDNPERPVAIFGEPGIGKTALNRRIAYANRYEMGGQGALVVFYEDFTGVRNKIQTGRITPYDHVEAIIKSAIVSVDEDIRSGRLSIPKTISSEEKLELTGFVEKFGDELALSLKMNLIKNLGVSGDSYKDLSLPSSYVSLLRRFCQAVQSLGYSRLLVLVDRLDEAAQITGEENIGILLPLMTDLNLLEMKSCSVSFRFFLPLALKQDLLTRGVRDDRIKIFDLSYTADDLAVILKQRLKAFSHGQYGYMAELIQGNPPEIDKRLIQAADGNPRKLINLCGRLITEHCRMGFSEDKLLIAQDVVEKVLSPALELEGDALAELNPTNFSNRLPTPLAALYLRYESATTSEQFLQHAFCLTQGILQYVVCCLLALYKQTDSSDQLLTEKLRGLLFNPQTPPSLGNWREAMDRLLKVKDRMNTTLVDPIGRFRKNKELGQTLNRLIELRNDFSHSRMSSSGTIHIRREVENNIRTLMASAEELGDLKLASVEGVSVQDDGSLLHRVRLYQGNVLIPLLQTTAFQQNYPSGHLVFYNTATNESADLSPFGVISDILIEEQTVKSEPVFIEQILQSQNSGKIIAQYIGWIDQSSIQSSKTIKQFIAKNLVVDKTENLGTNID